MISNQRDFRLHLLLDPVDQRKGTAVVDGNGDGSGEEDAPERGDPLGAILAPQQDAVGFADAGRLKLRGQPVRRGGHLAIGEAPQQKPVIVDEGGGVELGEAVKQVQERFSPRVRHRCFGRALAGRRSVRRPLRFRPHCRGSCKGRVVPVHRTPMVRALRAPQRARQSRVPVRFAFDSIGITLGKTCPHSATT